MTQPELIIIDTDAQIDGAIDYVRSVSFLALDTETTGVHKGAQVIGISVCGSEDKAYYIILLGWDATTKSLKTYCSVDKTKELLLECQKHDLIGHNFIFDAAKIEENFKIALMGQCHTDTMVLAHLLDENRRVGLKELSKIVLGVSADEQADLKESAIANGASWTKENKEMFKGDPYIVARYGAKDAWMTYMLFLALVPQLYDQNLDKFFYEEECMPLLRGPTYELNTVGLKVDATALQTLKKTLIAECEEHKAFIMKEIAVHIKHKYPGTKKTNTFNIGASQQLSWLVFGQLGLEFGTLTDGGKDACRGLGERLPYTPQAKRNFLDLCLSSIGKVYQPEAIVNGKVVKAKKIKEPWGYLQCNKTILKKHAGRYKWIETLLEYQRKMKLLSTYVEGIEERITYGTIQPSFLQTGTTSGRYSCRNPNFQNLPRDDKRVKGCIVSRPGRVFVGADYSQLEPRVFAYTSQDRRLLEAFRGTDDFYSVIGMGVFGKYDCTPQKEGSDDAFGVKYKKLRDLSKVVALASTYGATGSQLASTTGKSIAETQEIIDDYFQEFPDVKRMMVESHKQAMDNGYVLNLFGRPRRMPEAKRIRKLYGDKEHKDLPYEARSLLNLAVNHRIQSTGASIVNRAAIKFYENCKVAGIEAKLVLQVHDSLVAECAEADGENVALLLEDAMINTTVLEGILLEAVPKVGKTLADV